MLAGDPPWMISRSVAQIATASMRTRTSARPGTGVGLSRRKSSSGSPRTQAFIRAGMENSGDLVTPAGSYIGALPICDLGRYWADRILERGRAKIRQQACLFLPGSRKTADADSAIVARQIGFTPGSGVHEEAR